MPRRGSASGLKSARRYGMAQGGTVTIEPQDQELGGATMAGENSKQWSRRSQRKGVCG